MITQKEMLTHFCPLLDEKGKRYKKKSLIRAKKAIPGNVTVTKTSDGIETKNTASAGDWLVENQTSSGELYLVKKETFVKKYTLIQSLERGWGCYAPKGEIIGYQIDSEDLAYFEVKDVLEFQAPWKDTMIVKKGDFLVVPPEKNEIYRIAKKEFGETYVLI